MFWILLILGLIIIQTILLNHRFDDKEERGNINELKETGKAVVVDKMTERGSLTNLSQSNNPRYVLFIQTHDRKVIELQVNQQVFNDVQAGDDIIVRESYKGVYNFEKVS